MIFQKTLRPGSLLFNLRQFSFLFFFQAKFVTQPKRARRCSPFLVPLWLGTVRNLGFCLSSSIKILLWKVLLLINIILINIISFFFVRMNCVTMWKNDTIPSIFRSIQCQKMTARIERNRWESWFNTWNVLVISCKISSSSVLRLAMILSFILLIDLLIKVLV